MALPIWLAQKGIEQFKDQVIDAAEANGDVGRAESKWLSNVYVRMMNDQIAFIFVFPDFVGVTAWRNDVQLRIFRTAGSIEDAYAYFEQIAPRIGYQFIVGQEGEGFDYTFKQLERAAEEHLAILQLIDATENAFVSASKGDMVAR